MSGARVLREPGAPILTTDAISKTYVDNRGERVVALRDISIAIERHEFVSLIGPSGCGKSTILRIVAGLEKPTTGVVRVEGRVVSAPGADRGMIFQEYALFPWKNIASNIAFGPMLKGASPSEQREVAERMVALVGLQGFSQKYPYQLSGGMRQRAAVARSLANNPAVLLMDEPFAAIDAMTRQRLQEELARIFFQERTTVMFVTHSIDEAVFLSDRVIVLSPRPGQIVREVTVDVARPRTWDVAVKDEGFIKAREALLKALNAEQPEPAELSAPLIR